MRKEVKYSRPDKARCIQLFRQVRSLYGIMEDQLCTIQDLYDVLREAYFDKKI